MASSFANAERVTEGQTVAPSYLPLIGTTPNRTEQVSPGKSVTAVDLCALLADAIDATGQRKEAAGCMEISQPVLSKQLARTDGAAPRLDRVSSLKRETLVDFAQRILVACEAGDPRVERRQSAERAVRAIGELVALVMSA